MLLKKNENLPARCEGEREIWKLPFAEDRVAAFLGSAAELSAQAAPTCSIHPRSVHRLGRPISARERSRISPVWRFRRGIASGFGKPTRSLTEHWTIT